ncbi:acyltransferase family protein [Leifsonia poae]|uniref:O-antigen acetylase n=1 Tax=Leifsonia poae TaxID=110933 RepID=A0A9W6HBW1_9MICO|nr:acyltransferase family protein [Leifsonia poae]GLJ77674.1 O-antigen acetylase [Leifsonia poae]
MNRGDAASAAPTATALPIPTEPAHTPPPGAPTPQRLAHIDGLRAIAVAAVVLYHYGIPGIQNGFLGVDVFFVISGYVISRSLTTAHAKSQGRLRSWLFEFYGRRVWRIAPALLVMIGIVGVLFALFEPRGYASAPILWTSIGASVGVANLVLLGSEQGDYFGATTAFNPFLHTWSLGVEEQFYLIFPLLLWLLLSAGTVVARRRARLPVIVLALLSLGLAVWFWRTNPSASFYLLPTRFWELAAGALAFQAARWVDTRMRGNALRLVVSWVALAAIVASMVGVGGADSPFPAALLPVAATVLVIWFAPVERAGWGAPGRWLRATPVTWLGRVSYSLYLWHWPVIVIGLWVFGSRGPIGILVAIVAAVGLAALSYYGVERPILRSRVAHAPLRRSHWLLGGTAIALTLSIVVVIGWQHDRFSRASPISLSVTTQSGWANDRMPNQPEQTANDIAGAPRLLNIGDSHAGAYTAMVTAAAKNRGLSLTIASHSGCGFTLLAPVPTDGSCATAWEAIDSARSGDVAVFIGLRVPRIADAGELEPEYVADSPVNVASRGAAIAQFQPIARALTARGVKVVVNSPEPLFGRAPYLCEDWWFAANSGCAFPSTMERSAEVRRAGLARDSIDAVVAANPAVTVWNVFDALCPPSNSTCSQHDADGHALFVDTDHVSGWGNAAALPSFEAALDSALGPENSLRAEE